MSKHISGMDMISRLDLDSTVFHDVSVHCIDTQTQTENDVVPTSCETGRLLGMTVDLVIGCPSSSEGNRSVDTNRRYIKSPKIRNDSLSKRSALGETSYASYQVHVSRNQWRIAGRK